MKLFFHACREKSRSCLVLDKTKLSIEISLEKRGSNLRYFNKRLKQWTTCDVARVVRRLLRTILRYYRKVSQLLVYAAAYSIIRYLCSRRLLGRREAFGFAHALFNVSLDIYGI